MLPPLLLPHARFVGTAFEVDAFARLLLAGVLARSLAVGGACDHLQEALFFCERTRASSVSPTVTLV